MNTPKRVVPLQDQPGMPEAIATAVARSHGKVCAVCGLEHMGHGPESEWLGYEPHKWDGQAATAEQLERADKLTSLAYRARNLPAGLHRRPFDPSLTSIAARQADGHFNRIGHRLTGLYVSRDGIVWHLWRTCCKEPVPQA